MSHERLTLQLYLHREERDAWLCSLQGIGAGTYLPKSEIEIEAGFAVPGAEGFSLRSGPGQPPVGPVKVALPRWLAEDRGFVARPEPGQGALF